MIAAGIDLGGTKIEAQVFGDDWQLAARKRWTTPKSYPDLVAAMAGAVAWCQAQAHKGLPIGVSAAGMINPATGLALAANLAASGKPFPADIARAAGRPIAWINDCRALALSEARFGVAQGFDPALALIIGTGLSGGVVTGGQVLPAFSGLGGEVGHFPLPAGPMIAHGLPVLPCGCGRAGCTETLLSAPGLAVIALHVTGQIYTPEEVIAGRSTDAGLQKAWAIWLELACDFLITLCFTIDPAVIVIGGGLSNAPNITDDLARALQAATLKDSAIPSIRLAQGGDASGARGAAYAAWREGQS
jgi:predicted NBD/HSP70 family sugar kinase